MASQTVTSDLSISLVAPSEPTGFLALPVEIRISILEHVFEDELENTSFSYHEDSKGVLLRDDYSAAGRSAPLLVCRQIYNDGSLAALRRTDFVVTNMFFNIPERLSVFQPKQLEAIRSIAFVADDRHFRKLSSWGTCPFGMPELRLDTLTIALQRSSHWHYLFDYTPAIVKLLRQLEGVKRFVFVRNNARVKGSFRTWCNRLVGLMLKVDHQERYMVEPPNPEKVWWTWNFDAGAQVFSLEACPSKMMVDEETYMQQVLPLMQALTTSIEAEEWNPDPRSRIMYY